MDIYDIISNLKENPPIEIRTKEEYLNKWLNVLCAYRRCTFVKVDLCYICGKKDETKCYTTLNRTGIEDKRGWISCDECSKLVEVALKYIEINDRVIYFDKCKELIEYTNEQKHTHEYGTFHTPWNFWRISSNKSIKPRLQQGFIRTDCDDIVIINDELDRVCLMLHWYISDFDILCKSVPMCNVILFNRKIMGKNYMDFPPLKKNNDVYKHPDWKKNWISRLKYEYNKANKILTMLLCLKRLLPLDIYNSIVEDNEGIYWKNYIAQIEKIKIRKPKNKDNRIF